MDVGVALNEVKAYQDSAKNMSEQSVRILKAFKSIYRGSKRLKAAARNLDDIYQILVSEIERTEHSRTSGKVIDHQYYSVLKILQLALNYQKQAEDRLARIPALEGQACLVTQAAEYLEYAHLNIARSLKLLGK